MVDQELVRYVNEGIARGVPLDNLRNNLLKKGWAPEEIQNVFNYVGRGKLEGEKEFDKFPWKKLIFVFIGLVILGLIIFLVVSKIGGSIVLEETDLKKGVSMTIGLKPVILEFEGEKINIFLEETYSDSADINVNGVSLKFEIGEEILVDLNDDGSKDVKVRLNSIISGVPEFYFKLVDVASNGNGSSSTNNSLNGNKTVVNCSESWSCGNWSNCTNGSKIRNCTDSAKCGTNLTKPKLNVSCVEVGVFESPQEACMDEIDTSKYYNDSLVCISDIFSDTPFEVIFDNQNVSCCKGIPVFTPEEACALENQTYFNSSYGCDSYSSLNYNGTVINCCDNITYLKYVIDEELNYSWNEIPNSEICSINLADSLANCAEYKCSFEHPFDEAFYEKGVVFERDGLCYYYEEMPNGGTYLCKYDSNNLFGAEEYWREYFNTGQTNDDFANEMISQRICQVLG